MEVICYIEKKSTAYGAKGLILPHPRAFSVQVYASVWGEVHA